MEIQNECAEIKIRAECKAGNMLAEMEKNPGAATPLHDVTALPPKLEELGVTRIQSYRWQRLHDIPEEHLARYIAECAEIKIRAECKAGSMANKGVSKNSGRFLICYTVAN